MSGGASSNRGKSQRFQFGLVLSGEEDHWEPAMAPTRSWLEIQLYPARRVVGNLPKWPPRHRYTLWHLVQRRMEQLCLNPAGSMSFGGGCSLRALRCPRLGPKPHSVSEAVPRLHGRPTRYLWPDPSPALHGGILRFDWLGDGLGEFARPGNSTSLGSVFRCEGSPGGAVAARSVSGVRWLCEAGQALCPLDLLMLYRVRMLRSR